MKSAMPKTDTRVPKTAVLEMTYACNHDCLFCSVPWQAPGSNFSRLPELSVAEWKGCIDILVEKGDDPEDIRTNTEPVKGLDGKEVVA